MMSKVCSLWSLLRARSWSCILLLRIGWLSTWLVTRSTNTVLTAKSVKLPISSFGMELLYAKTAQTSIRDWMISSILECMSSTSFTSSGMTISSEQWPSVATKNCMKFSKNMISEIYQLKKNTDTNAQSGTPRRLWPIWIIRDIKWRSQPKTWTRVSAMPQWWLQTGFLNKRVTWSPRSNSSRIKLEISQGKWMKRRLKLVQS